MSGHKVYIGDLGNDANRGEIEEAFGYYGSLKNVWVARRPPGFAFVEFERLRDAEDAVRGLDGRMLCGRRVRVELSSGRSRWPGGRPPSHILRQPAPRWIPDKLGGSRRSRSLSRSRLRKSPSVTRNRKDRRSPDRTRNRSPKVHRRSPHTPSLSRSRSPDNFKRSGRKRSRSRSL